MTNRAQISGVEFWKIIHSGTFLPDDNVKVPFILAQGIIFFLNFD